MPSPMLAFGELLLKSPVVPKSIHGSPALTITVVGVTRGWLKLAAMVLKRQMGWPVSAFRALMV